VPPISHPRSFPLPPAMNPPMNTAKNDSPRINQVMDVSVKLVNLRSKENSKLVTRAKIKILDSP